MEQHEELIRVLNEAVSLEYMAAIHYNQHSTLLTGQNKLLYEHLFKESAQDALGHAKKWGNRIVYLGGVAKVELGEIKQSTDITEMLEMSLEIEQQALETYRRAHKICKHEPTLYMLEDQIMDEDRDVERLQKLLGRVNIARALSKGTKRPAA